MWPVCRVVRTGAECLRKVVTLLVVVVVTQTDVLCTETRPGTVQEGNEENEASKEATVEEEDTQGENVVMAGDTQQLLPLV